MSSTHKIQLKQHKKRLNLSHRELNKMDRKHNDTNLIKQLQLLNPVTANVTPSNTGFYGRIIIYNKKLLVTSTGTNITYTLYAINGTTQTLLRSATTISCLFTNPDPLTDLNKLDIAIGSRFLDANTKVRIVATLANQNANFLGASVTGATQLNGPNGWPDDLDFSMTINSDRINNGIVTVQYLTN